MFIENLEGRRLMSVSALPAPASAAPGVSGGVLTVTGTEGEDHITVGREGGRVVVTEWVVTDATPENVDSAQAMSFGFGKIALAHRRTVLTQTISRVVVNANGGDDRVALKRGGLSLDVAGELNGGAGDDRLRGGRGNDTINGGFGNDQLHGGGGGAGDDTLNGDQGRDRLVGAFGADTLNGGDNRDFIFGGAGIDRLFGGNGDDRLFTFDRGPNGVADQTIDGGANNTFRNDSQGDKLFRDAADRETGDTIETDRQVRR